MKTTAGNPNLIKPTARNREKYWLHGIGAVSVPFVMEIVYLAVTFANNYRLQTFTGNVVTLCVCIITGSAFIVTLPISPWMRALILLFYIPALVAGMWVFVYLFLITFLPPGGL